MSIFKPGMTDFLDRLNELAQAAFGQIQADWNAPAGSVKAIANKPTLAAVATSGNKADVGLGKVENLTPAEMPVSTAVAAELATKANLTATTAALGQKFDKTGGTISGPVTVQAGAPGFVVDNSTSIKLCYQENGVVRGYTAADATYCWRALNAANNLYTASLDNSGNFTLAGNAVVRGAIFTPTNWGNAAVRSSGAFGGGISLADSGAGGTSGAVIYAQGPELRINAVSNNGLGNGISVGINYVAPVIDRGSYLGLGSYRWDTIFSYTSSITTSDARWKTVVRNLLAAEMAWAQSLAQEIGFYQFLNEVDAKGADVARLHCGMTVQRAMALGELAGLDATRYAFICHDVWEDEFEDVPPVYETQVVRVRFHQVEVIDGRAVLVEGERDEEQVVTEQIPVFDAQGNAVYHTEPAQLDEEGNEIAPARDVPMMHTVPVIAQPATRRLIREAGDIYSFRTDQLALFIARGLTARLAALESS